jgi:hypothetical protein
MTRPLHSLFVVLAVIAWCSPVSGQDDYRDDMKQSIDAAVEKVTQNYEQFLADSESPIEKARTELTELNAQLNAKKMSKEATEVQIALNGLDQLVMKRAVPIVVPQGPKPRPPAPQPAVQKPLLSRLVGQWTHPNLPLVYHFEPNSVFHENWKADGKENARGPVVIKDDQVAEVMLSNGYRLRVLIVDADTLAVLVFDRNGQPAGDGLVVERR